MKDMLSDICSFFILHPSAFILALEPVAQMDESASLRSLRAHVRVVPGSFDVPGSSKGRMPVFETGDEGSSPSPGVRCLFFKLEWRKRQTRGVEIAVGLEGPLRVRPSPRASERRG